jgi:hypothetical protein
MVFGKKNKKVEEPELTPEQVEEARAQELAAFAVASDAKQRSYRGRRCVALLGWSFIFLYIFVGGTVFQEMEGERERLAAVQYCELSGRLERQPGNETAYLTAAAVSKAMEKRSICNVPVCVMVDGEMTFDPDHLNWTFLGSCLYCITVFTTIGYGNYVPQTEHGKGFTVVYFIGGAFIFGTINYMTAMIVDDVLLQFWTKRLPNRRIKLVITVRNLSEAFLLLLWVMIMAAVYCTLEGWTFADGMYFSFITVSTIGLGDLAPTKTRDELLLHCFFMFGGMNLLTAFLHSTSREFHLKFETITDVHKLMLRTKVSSERLSSPCPLLLRVFLLLLLLLLLLLRPIAVLPCLYFHNLNVA